MQLYFKTAFLNVQIGENIYFEHPQGFVRDDYEDSVYVVHKVLHRLKKNSPSLVQSPQSLFGEEWI